MLVLLLVNNLALRRTAGAWRRATCAATSLRQELLQKFRMLLQKLLELLEHSRIYPASTTTRTRRRTAGAWRRTASSLLLNFSRSLNEQVISLLHVQTELATLRGKTAGKSRTHRKSPKKE
jgi:hypothetical protein